MIADLTEWDSFYVIVGSAAGALIGLQFVVMTLVAQSASRAADAGAAFGTPTIVHFGTALLLAAVLRAPWHMLVVPAALWGLVGWIGVAYAALTTRRMHKQSAYEPEFEDWLFHAALPLLAYLALALSPLAIGAYAHEALFVVGGAILLLLFIGIHNSWDATAYHVFVTSRNRDED